MYAATKIIHLLKGLEFLFIFVSIKIFLGVWCDSQVWHTLVCILYKLNNMEKTHKNFHHQKIEL